MTKKREDLSIEEIYETEAYKELSEFRKENPDFSLNDIFNEREIVNLLYPVIVKEIKGKLNNHN